MSIRDLIPRRFSRGQEVPVRRVENPFRSAFDEMDRFVERFFSDFAVPPMVERDIFTPKVDLTEKGNEYRLTAELPGMDEKDVDVILDDDVITIKGEKKEEKEDRQKDYYYAERSYGFFQRTIPLPAEVDKDRVKATFKKGILTVELPKSEKAIREARKIEVLTE
ncbi:MAG TPA: Hsp20/alpha crystallin family protein [Nitrospirae bacterium]|nr:spore protein SP21 [bacterium BMS3Abin08]HDO35096.1 Hsp20/alpha crystallin family protein [Nitrospirota bacterium]HDY71606.1 Hsp20/alpha crystallin family protein [Nitrospirota bacterium]